MTDEIITEIATRYNKAWSVDDIEADLLDRGYPVALAWRLSREVHGVIHDQN